MPKKPIAYTSDSDVANMIADRLLTLSDKGITQQEVAELAGYDKPNVLNMFKSGKTRVPLNRAVPLAKALDVDPAIFLMMVFKEYHPELYDVMKELIPETGLKSEAAVRVARMIDKISADSKLMLAPDRVSDKDLESALLPIVSIMTVSRDGQHIERTRPSK